MQISRQKAWVTEQALLGKLTEWWVKRAQVPWFFHYPIERNSGVCVFCFFSPLSFRFGLLFFVFFPAVCSMQGFSSLTRDPIHTPCTEPPGNLWKLIQGSAPSTFLLCEYEKAALSPRGISWLLWTRSVNLSVSCLWSCLRDPGAGWKHLWEMRSWSQVALSPRHPRKSRALLDIPVYCSIKYLPCLLKL